MQDKKQQLEPNMEQQNGSKLEKEHYGSILSPCLFNLYASTLWKMLGWMNHTLESRLLGERATTSDMQMIPL